MLKHEKIRVRMGEGRKREIEREHETNKLNK
jgi:hypothetical protein